MSKAADLANLIGNINAGGGGVNRNVIINGAMNVAQRSTSETGIGATAGYHTVDRFQIAVGGTATAGRLTMSQDSSCLLYTSPSPRDRTRSRMPSSA